MSCILAHNKMKKEIIKYIESLGQVLSIISSYDVL